jgi:branched-chain amino acid transport system permease protein
MLFNIVFGLVVMGVLFVILQKTKLGLAVRCTASNEPTARLMGVPTRTVTLMAWSVAGVLGMLAGVMIAPRTTVSVFLMNPVQVNALVACVLGGFQTFYGPVIAAYIIAVGFNWLNTIDSTWGGQFLYLLILIFLIFRPNGLIGKKYVKKV